MVNQASYLRVVLPTLVLVGLVLFQNCSAKHELSSELTQQSLSSTTSLILEDRVQQNLPFRVTLSAENISSGMQFYWSGIYLSGPPCTHTLTMGGAIATFTCSQLGDVAIRLVATAADGTMNVYDMPVVVGDGVTGTPPTPTPGPTPLPTPGPQPINGAPLYSTNCSGCHGALASSSKRGVTRARLDQGIANVGAMAGLTGLTSAQRDAIVTALQ